MKYRYIIEEDGNLNGINNLSPETIDNVRMGICEVIDCEHGEFLQSVDPDEWGNIEPLIEL